MLLAGRDVKQLQLNKERIDSLANYLYDQMLSTPCDQWHVNNFRQWLLEFVVETPKDKATRYTSYNKNPHTRTPEYHKQLVRTAKQRGLIQKGR